MATLLGVIRGAAAASRVLRGGTGLAAGLLCCVDSVEVKEDPNAKMLKDQNVHRKVGERLSLYV